MKVDETTLVEGYCQFCNSDLHPVIVQCIEDLSEKSVDRLIKVEQPFIADKIYAEPALLLA